MRIRVSAPFRPERGPDVVEMRPAEMKQAIYLRLLSVARAGFEPATRGLKARSGPIQLPAAGR